MQTLDDFLATHDLGDLLDIACGGGRFTRQLVDHCRTCRAVVGLDIKDGARDDFLDSVGEVVDTAVDSVTFVAAPIADYLDRAELGFDTVSMANALHHVEGIGHILGRLRPILRPGGIVIIQEMHADGLTAAQEVQRDLHAFMAQAHRAAGEFHRGVFTRAEIDGLLTAAGLTVRHRFHAANDTPPEPGASGPLPQRLEEAIRRAWPQGIPDDLEARRAALLARAAEVGVGTPPQSTLVCSFA